VRRSTEAAMPAVRWPDIEAGIPVLMAKPSWISVASSRWVVLTGQACPAGELGQRGAATLAVGHGIQQGQPAAQRLDSFGFAHDSPEDNGCTV
jgi:hypothetical protein